MVDFAATMFDYCWAIMINISNIFKNLEFHIVSLFILGIHPGDLIKIDRNCGFHHLFGPSCWRITKNSTATSLSPGSLDR